MTQRGTRGEDCTPPPHLYFTSSVTRVPVFTAVSSLQRSTPQSPFPSVPAQHFFLPQFLCSCLHLLTQTHSQDLVDIVCNQTGPTFCKQHTHTHKDMCKHTSLRPCAIPGRYRHPTDVISSSTERGSAGHTTGVSPVCFRGKVSIDEANVESSKKVTRLF